MPSKAESRDEGRGSGCRRIRRAVKADVEAKR